MNESQEGQGVGQIGRVARPPGHKFRHTNGVGQAAVASALGNLAATRR